MKIAPHYAGVTVYVPDASRAVGVASNLLSDELKQAYVTEVAAEYETVRAQQDVKLKNKLPIRGVEQVRLAPDGSVKAAVANLERRPEVRYAQPNYYRRAMATPLRCTVCALVV